MNRIKQIALLAVTGSVIGGVGIAWKAGYLPNPFPLGKTLDTTATVSSRNAKPSAKAAKPIRADRLPITVNHQATVEPYYQAELRARASGIVRSVKADIGDLVKKGDALIEIDVPESEQEVARAKAMILQREQEWKVSLAKVKDAQAARLVSAATIKQRQAEAQGLTATRDLKKKRFERFRDLAARGSVAGPTVDEEERDFLASESAVLGALANVERTKADYEESGSKLEAAEADVELKKAQIEVARKELDRAIAVADYGKITAPFDGVVVRRRVDPGSFVQNATTGASEALIAIAKTDLMTISARFPDTVASYVAVGMNAMVQIDDLPGVTIAAQVTRFAPTVQNADRTMRVEVDLYNGDDAGYQQMVEAVRLNGPNKPTKGPNDPLPKRAFPADSPRRLIAGMTGTMTLTVGGFGESFVLPRTAVVSAGGSTTMTLVEDGRTKRVPVKVQLSDGKTVRVAIVETTRDANGVARDVLKELTGREVVLIARQGDFLDGTEVTVSFTD